MQTQHMLIIGGGLAGSWLGFELLQRGHRVTLAHRSLPGESSPVAAGLFHPAPGKSWQLRAGFAKEYPLAKQSYQALAVLSSKPLWHELLLSRDLTYAPNAQRWSQIKSGKATLSLATLSPWIERIEPRAVLFHSSGRIDVPQTLRVLHHYIAQHSRGQLWDTLIEDAELIFQKEQICVRSNAFAQVILCRGWREAQGIGGKHLAWRNAAGEILRLQYPRSLPPWIHSAKHWQIPLNQTQALSGATHRWHEFSSQAKPSSVQLLFKEFTNAKQANATPLLLEAQGGVRPIQQAKAVLCEQTTQHPRLWVFNSLASHGALRAPVYAHQLAKKLTAR